MDKFDLRDAKDRLSIAAARLLAGDRAAALEADEAMAKILRIMAKHRYEEAHCMETRS